MAGFAGRLLAVVSTAAMLTTSCFADGDATPDATPYRPTVTTPAALSASHWLEAEFGGLSAHDGSAAPSRTSLPYTIKYAFSEDWGVRVGGEAYVRTAGDGERVIGFGDTGFVVKRRFAVDDASAFGLEVGALYPTTHAELHLGSGKPDYAVNGIYSVDLAGWHSDVNVIGTRLGAHDDGVARWQSIGAIAVSHPLVDRWQIAAEWAGTRQTGVPAATQVLGALSWSVRRDIVVDVGGVRGLHRSPLRQVFAGATVVLGRID